MTLPDIAFDQVKALVDKFKSLSPTARRALNEKATRQGFILLLFQSLEHRIARVDAEIDRQVYAMYGLTEEKIRVVEGG